MRAAGIALAALLAGAGLLNAQEMRDYSVARQRHGESRLQARLEFAAGTIQIAAGRDDQLYSMQLRYDPERFSPISRFNGGDGSLALGITNAGKSGLRVASRSQLTQTASVQLSPAVTLSLDATLGAADATIELGGLRLEELRLKTGASRTALAFSRANSIRCSSMIVESGAAELMLDHLGNSRCETVRITGGIGLTTLDLRGVWGARSTVAVKMTAGGLALRIPSSVGVRVRSQQFLSSFPSKGWTRRDGALLSPGYDAAVRHVDLALETALGNVEVEWVR